MHCHSWAHARPASLKTIASSVWRTTSASAPRYLLPPGICPHPVNSVLHVPGSQACHTQGWGGRLSVRHVLSACSITTRAAAMAGAAAPTQPQLPKVVVVTGPTGVGKTAISLVLAEQLGGEVVSADSVQVYRGLDIGSDKLSLAERRGVPHHLLDVCDVTEEYTAGRFHDEGRAAIRDILARGRVPVVAGGTGFYLRLLVEGKPATQRATPEQEEAVEESLRQAWQQAAAAAGLSGADALTAEARWEAGVALLGAAGDKEAMQRIGEERNNYFRLKRALAILAANPGRTMRDLDVPTTTTTATDTTTTTASTAPSAENQAEFDFRTFFLYRPRAVLYDKVDRRLQEMVLGGLLDEACLLLRQGIDPGSNMASSAVGYRQAMNWLLEGALDLEGGGQVDGGLDDLAMSICVATHRLIRSQMTWFRGRDEYTWLDVDVLGSSEAAAAAIMQHVAEPVHTGKPLPGQGMLDRGEQQEFRERRLTMQVLASRPQDVATVMAHVTGQLLPGLLGDPAAQPVLAGAKRRREEARAAAAAQVAEAEAVKRERAARKAAAKEAHMQRNMAAAAAGQQGARKQQRREGAGQAAGQAAEQGEGQAAEQGEGQAAEQGAGPTAGQAPGGAAAAGEAQPCVPG